MVEPVLADPKSTRRAKGTWEAAQGELHSELMKARATLISKYMKEDGMSMTDAIEFLKEAEKKGDDTLFEWYMDNAGGNLNKHFKESIPYETKKKLTQLLPAVVGVSTVGAAGMSDDVRVVEAPEYRQGGI
jgi:hypothetical protein